MKSLAGYMISENAKIHPSVKISPGCIIYPNVTIEMGVIIGPYSVIGFMPEHRSFYEDLEFKESKGVLIRKDARIFEFVTIHAGTQHLTEIGIGAAIFNHSHIAHDCTVSAYATIGGQCSLAGHTHVMQHAIISGKSCTHQHAVVGAFSILGAASYLKNHIPPGEKWMGNPARPAGYNDIGLRRFGISVEDCLRRHQEDFEFLKKEKSL